MSTLGINKYQMSYIENSAFPTIEHDLVIQFVKYELLAYVHVKIGRAVFIMGVSNEKYCLPQTLKISSTYFPSFPPA